jgi:hypothetical protein
VLEKMMRLRSTKKCAGIIKGNHEPQLIKWEEL